MAKRVRAARHYQRDDDPVLRLSRSAYRSVARELKSAFTNLSSMASHDELVDALRHGRNPASTINWHHYREVLRGAFTRLGKLRAAGGELGARKINGAFAARGRQVQYRKRKSSKLEANYRKTTSANNCGACWMFQLPQSCCAVEGVIDSRDTCDFWESVFAKAASQFTFDSSDSDIQDEIRAEQDRLIAQLESDARDAIETIIQDGVANDTDLSDVADEVKDMIGLTDTQAQAVLNYQTMLQNLDPGALDRQLRNTDYDAVLQDSIDAGTDLSDDAIENMVDDYIENYLDYRAATIAQTESTRAANLGLHDAYSQAIDRGALSDDAVTRFWQLADNPCPICESIVDNNPDGVGVDESFDSDDGPIDDPPVHPNCECSVEYVTDLTSSDDDDGG